MSSIGNGAIRLKASRRRDTTIECVCRRSHRDRRRSSVARTSRSTRQPFAGAPPALYYSAADRGTQPRAAAGHVDFTVGTSGAMSGRPRGRDCSSTPAFRRGRASSCTAHVSPAPTLSVPDAPPIVRRCSISARRSSSTSRMADGRRRRRRFGFRCHRRRHREAVAGLIRDGGTLVSIVGPAEARPADGLAVDFVVGSDRATE
jgi:hypothetical protein